MVREVETVSREWGHSLGRWESKGRKYFTKKSAVSQTEMSGKMRTAGCPLDQAMWRPLVNLARAILVKWVEIRSLWIEK